MIYSEIVPRYFRAKFVHPHSSPSNISEPASLRACFLIRSPRLSVWRPDLTRTRCCHQYTSRAIHRHQPVPSTVTSRAEPLNSIELSIRNKGLGQGIVWYHRPSPHLRTCFRKQLAFIFPDFQECPTNFPTVSEEQINISDSRLVVFTLASQCAFVSYKKDFFSKCWPKETFFSIC